MKEIEGYRKTVQWGIPIPRMCPHYQYEVNTNLSGEILKYFDDVVYENERGSGDVNEGTWYNCKITDIWMERYPRVDEFKEMVIAHHWYCTIRENISTSRPLEPIDLWPDEMEEYRMCPIFSYWFWKEIISKGVKHE